MGCIVFTLLQSWTTDNEYDLFTQITELTVFPSVCCTQNVTAERNTPYICKSNNLLLV